MKKGKGLLVVLIFIFLVVCVGVWYKLFEVILNNSNDTYSEETYESIDDTIEELSSVKEGAGKDVAKILAEGTYSVNDIERIADYFMSEIYWGNIYLYKDFDEIEQQILESEGSSYNLVYLRSDYTNLAIRTSSEKPIAVLDDLRVNYQNMVMELEDNTILYNEEITAKEMINSSEWIEFRTMSEETYLTLMSFQEQIVSFLLDIAPSQSSIIEERLEKINQEKEVIDTMNSFY